MKSYSVVYNPTGEIILEVDDKQVQYANDLLAETKRLGLHTAAARHANSRDRAIRYGNAHKHPVGVVKAARAKRRTWNKSRMYKRRPRYRLDTQVTAVVVSLIALGGVIFVVVAALVSY